jgi:endonuclease/exonuclease/phosphatase (EEP) superfamily protein YafD
VTITLAAFAVTLALGGWKPAAALLVPLIVNVCLVAPFYLPRATAMPTDDTVRVMSANVHSSNHGHDDLLNVIHDHRPDLLLILEYTRQWQEALSELTAEYPYTYFVPRAGNFGMALYSRLRLRSVHVSRLGHSGPECLRADIEVSRQSLRLVGVHTFPPVSATASAARDFQFSEIARIVQKQRGPCVVIGDLNCTSWSPQFRRLLRACRLRDSRRGFGVQATWPDQAKPLMIPIDHCLVTAEVTVCDRRVTRSIGSDHRGIIVDLAISAPGS